MVQNKMGCHLSRYVREGGMYCTVQIMMPLALACENKMLCRNPKTAVWGCLHGLFQSFREIQLSFETIRCYACTSNQRRDASFPTPNFFNEKIYGAEPNGLCSAIGPNRRVSIANQDDHMAIDSIFCKTALCVDDLSYGRVPWYWILSVVVVGWDSRIVVSGGIHNTFLVDPVVSDNHDSFGGFQQEIYDQGPKPWYTL
jgi:hypothetical protein